MYLTAPDHVWALDARTGREIWHFIWQSKGGIHIGNRGAAIYRDWLYFETPDCNLVSLNIKDGNERWHKQICDLDQFYYGSVAPMIVKNHVMVGVSGDDLDVPATCRRTIRKPARCSGAGMWCRRRRASRDRRRWPNEDAMKHGGGMTWQPFTYDPELNQMYVTTGNPQPVIAHVNRAGANLFTASIVVAQPGHREDERGTSSRRRTIRMTGTRRRRRCSSTARSTGSRENSSRRRRATAISSCSIAPTARPSSRPST